MELLTEGEGNMDTGTEYERNILKNRWKQFRGGGALYKQDKTGCMKACFFVSLPVHQIMNLPQFVLDNASSSVCMQCVFRILL